MDDWVLNYPAALPPTADAGNDDIVHHAVVLDGSGSSDPDGTIVLYEWQLLHRENSDYDKTANGMVVTVSGLKKGFYDVTLTVTDNDGLQNTDAMLLGVAGNKVVVVPLF
jgi:sirohydrochlorin ferrochelatase